MKKRRIKREIRKLVGEPPPVRLFRKSQLAVQGVRLLCPDLIASVADDVGIGMDAIDALRMYGVPKSIAKRWMEEGEKAVTRAIEGLTLDPDQLMKATLWNRVENARGAFLRRMTYYLGQQGREKHQAALAILQSQNPDRWRNGYGPGRHLDDPPGGHKLQVNVVLAGGVDGGEAANAPRIARTVEVETKAVD